ncbi:MAG: hypothetical protein WDA74_09145 [Spirochaetota bacterium]
MVPSLREEIIFVGNAVERVKGVASWVKDVAGSAWSSWDSGWGFCGKDR